MQPGAQAPDFVRMLADIPKTDVPLILLWSLNDLTDTVKGKWFPKALSLIHI